MGFFRSLLKISLTPVPISIAKSAYDHVYAKGKLAGKKEGHARASEEYEKKLLKQADEFLKQKQIFEQQRDEYEKLLTEYEAEIECLQQNQARTEAENQYLRELLSREKRLRKLVG